jgi:hypothetical protein
MDCVTIINRLHAFPNFPIPGLEITGKLHQMQEKYYRPNGLDTLANGFCWAFLIRTGVLLRLSAFGNTGHSPC